MANEQQNAQYFISQLMGHCFSLYDIALGSRLPLTIIHKLASDINYLLPEKHFNNLLGFYCTAIITHQTFQSASSKQRPNHTIQNYLKSQCKKTKAQKIMVQSPKAHITTLTPKEQQCLFKIMTHTNKKVTAQNLNISIRTLEYHLQNIRIKCLSKSLLTIYTHWIVIKIK